MVTIDIAQASELQSAIQRQLAEYGYSSADDAVMAEYVTVMLANSKSGPQITAELSDLIGSEYDAGFTDWIFETAIPEHYSRPASASKEAPAPAPAEAAAAAAAAGSSNSNDLRNQPAESQSQDSSPAQIQTVGDSREYGNRPRHGLPSRPGGGGGAGGPSSNARGNGGQRGPAGMFGNAMAGLKREHDGPQDRPNRRPRMSSENEGAAAAGDQRSIFDRAGVRAGTAQPNNFNNMGGPFANGRGGGPQRRGGPGGFQQGGFAQQQPQIPGLPPLHIPDNFNSLPPAQQQAIQQQIFQHQLIAAAAAQQMYAQNGQGGPQPPQGMMQPPPHFGMQNGQQQQQPNFGQQKQQQQRPPKPVTLPPRPTSEELCKYGVECKNAICRYSHPSPAATKESGLVLTKEVCDKGIECEDKDCPKSHVSPAQKTDPQGLNVSQYKQKSKSSAPASAPAAPVHVHVPAANPGAKPCMFGAACTRPGCFFSHPVPGGGGASATPCRFGVNCTRKDCHFAHPEGRKIDNAAFSPSTAGNNFPSFASNRGNMSATFGSAAGKSPTAPSTAAAAAANGAAQASEEASKMSARMKRFTEGQGQGEAERIVAGKQEPPANAAGEAKSTQDDSKDDDLEVVI